VPHITVVTVNYKTRKLTKVCYESFRKFYPDTPIILVDNHSQDDSTKYIKSLEATDSNLTTVFHSTNLGHGPAMHHAIQSIFTPFVFTLDSDCKILKGGFLENMLQYMDNNGNLYAIGWLRYIVKFTGVPHSWHTNKPPRGNKFIPYIHPYAALYRLSMYRKLRPFADHGAPCIWNMNDAVGKGYDLQHMKLDGYIKHWKAGTRRRFGGHWHPSDSVQPGAWDADKNYPI